MTLPPWLEPLPDAAQMRAIDTWAIEQQGIAGITLMEAAGTAVADAVEGLAGGGRVAIVAGKGNNGGDGFVAARLLRARGRDVDLLLVGDPSAIAGDAAVNLGRLDSPPVPFDPARLAGAGVVVDALLGTGFTGEVAGEMADAIDAIGEVACPVVAVDVPSGVDASTGEAGEHAVRAACTVTFAHAKPGLWIAPGKQHAGDVQVVDIGIPLGAPALGEVAAGLIGDAVLEGVPRRDAASNKFTAGSLAVIGGSTGLTGATVLAARAAARAGAGYVTAFVPASLNTVFESHLLEVMTVPVADASGALTRAGAATVIDQAGAMSAAVIGPGLGRTPGAQRFAVDVTAALECPLVVDADAINALAGRPQRLAGRGAATVLTPHPGELGRLLGTNSGAIGRCRLAHARQAAAATGAIVVLKGDDTVVAEPGGRVAVSRGGAPALATAGSGDVLAGMVGALIARGGDPFGAACAAVHAHCAAARAAASALGSADGVIASDLLDRLPGGLAL